MAACDRFFEDIEKDKDLFFYVVSEDAQMLGVAIACGDCDAVYIDGAGEITADHLRDCLISLRSKKTESALFHSD